MSGMRGIKKDVQMPWRVKYKLKADHEGREFDQKIYIIIYILKAMEGI
ncbi:hypothetical protein PITCH_A290016 [uncultured Desulfobacterium sp.]|uniref:Uncharacterized protein n=1 Tax=uncultured Desulfobacterium sp. TaxID=201089 RepID=A0A445MZ39_9BACT|nr:hypothetical protein PITCH_A290016 [uncultured Desulfobacterium sp.]